MRILAPSNQGYVARELRYESFWNVKPKKASIRVTASPVVVASFKGPTTKTLDHKRPTDYVRMIGKIIPRTPCDAWNNTYVIKSDIWAGSLAALPLGCQYSTGSVVVPTWMTDKVVLDALNEMQQIDANILEDLGQLKQTGEMIAQIFRAIGEGFLLARKGKWKALRRLLVGSGVNVPRRVANGWLLYFYGIKPLIGTIEALANSENTIDKAIKVRKRVSINVSGHDFISSSLGALQLPYSGTAVQQAQCVLEARIKLSGNLHTWQNLGITSSSITDLVVTSWALVPYSFVVDWFIPVENWLRTLVWSPFLVYQGGYVGRRVEANGYFVNRAPWSGQWPYQGTLPSYSLQVKFYKRTYYPYSVPSVALSIRTSLNLTQIISASALITSRS